MIEALNRVADMWLAWELAMLWQVAVLIAIVWAVDLVIRRWAWPQVRYALWLLVLVKLLLPPTLTSPTSFTAEIASVVQRVVSVQTDQDQTPRDQNHQDLKPAEVYEIPAAEVEVPFADLGLEGTEGFSQREFEAAPAAIAPAIPAAAPAAVVRLSWKVYAFMVWLGGMAFLSIWLILRLSGLRREHLKSGQRMPDRFNELVAVAAKRLKLRVVPKLILTDRVCCPAVFGVFRPVLLIPAGKLSSLTREDAEHILLHELAHIKRGDLFVHAVYMMIQIAYWFNPLLWLIRRQLQNLRELCCDATVARLLKEKTFSYRETLLKTARQLLAESVDPGLGLLGLFESSNWLVERLKWLERKTWRNRRLRIATIVLLVAVMAACVLPMTKNKENQGSLRAIDEKLNVSDKAGELTINSLYMASPGGKRLLGNSVTVSVEVTNNSEKEIYLSFEYYTDSGKVAIFFSPGASHLAQIRKVAPNWQGRIEFPVRYNRFVKGGYVKITLAKCSGDQLMREDGLLFLPFDSEVLHEKKYGILSVGQQKEVAGLLDTLRTAKGRQRLRAAEKLAKYGRSVVPAIMEMLQDNNVWAAHALGLIGPEAEDAVPALIKLLTQGGDGGVRGFSASALRKIGPAAAQAIPALIGTLNDKSANTRMHAAEALGYLSTGEKDVIEALTAALQDEDETVRKAADRSLRRIEDTMTEFTATLPNGVTVELVGVCEHPSKGKQWWRPDGYPFTLPEGLNIKESSLVNTDDEAYEFLFKYQFESEMSSSYNVEGSTGTATMSTIMPDGGTGGYLAVKVHFREPPESTTARVSVATGSWQSEMAVARQTDMRVRLSTGWAKFSKAVETETGVELHFEDTLLDKQHRLVAIDRKGKPHSGRMDFSNDGRIRLSTARFKKLKLSEIKEFQFQTRPWSRAEFKGVSLRPDKTWRYDLPGPDSIKFGSSSARVVDSRGRGVYGAIVEFGDELTIRDYRNNKTEKRKWNVDDTVTDSVGRFPMPSIYIDSEGKTVSFDATITAEGFLDRRDVTLGEYDNGSGTIDLFRGMSVEGVVIGPDGQPLGKAPLSLLTHTLYEHPSSGCGGCYDIHMTTEEDGYFRLENVPPGLHILQYPGRSANCDDPEPLPAQNVSGAAVLKVEDGRDVEGVLIDLSESTCSVTGRIVDEKGRPIEGVKAGVGVELKITSKDKDGAVVGISSTDNFPPSELTGPDGVYHIENLPPGDWLIGASYPYVKGQNAKAGPSDKIHLSQGETTNTNLTLKRQQFPEQKTYEQTEGRKAVDAAKWVEGKAIMGTLAVAIRAWVAETLTDGSWTQDELTYKRLGFLPVDLRGTYFSAENFSWKVSYHKADNNLTFTITATAGKGITTPASVTMDQNGKLTEQQPAN